MKIDGEMVEHLERLARIELTSEEKERFTEQLARIVDYVEQLQEIDTDRIRPTSLVLHGKKRELRKDEAQPGLERDVILGQAPDSTGEYFRVPKIIER